MIRLVPRVSPRWAPVVRRFGEFGFYALIALAIGFGATSIGLGLWLWLPEISP